MVSNYILYAILALWVFGAICILRERRNIRVMIYLNIFSLISSLAYFLLGSPDAGMAEAAVGAFTTIFFIVCFEKYEELHVDGASPEFEAPPAERVPPFKRFIGILAPLTFTVAIAALFLHAAPDSVASVELKHRYLAEFAQDVGGENAVTAIYLGYRVYDTLFEALLLVLTVLAVTHMSYSKNIESTNQKRRLKPSVIEILVMRVICVLILLFGVYLIVNGHISAGGGFQGGLFIAAFFICRFLVHNIYDLPIKKLFRLEEFIFAITILMAVFVVFLGASSYLPVEYLPAFQGFYMILMNFVIGMKVACGFIILFYRYVTIERS